MCMHVCSTCLAKGEPATAVELIPLPDGRRHVGELNGERQPHGSGTKFSAVGSEETSGRWRNGKLHGRGQMILLNGDRYEGEFVDDQRSGLGVLTMLSGYLFEGEWADAAQRNGRPVGPDWRSGEMRPWDRRSIG